MIPCIALLFLALVARLTLRSWAYPSAFFAAVWSAYLVVSLTLSPFESLNGGLWWIALTIFAMYLGNVVDAHHAPPAVVGKAIDPAVSFPYLSIIVTICLGATTTYWMFSPTYVLADTGTKPPFTLQFALAGM